LKTIKNIIINLCILLVMLAILFGIGEVVARIRFSFSESGPTAVSLQIFEGSDIYGWGHAPGSLDHHGYGEPTPEVSINSLGFRDDEITIKKPENTKRILVLGDSFTFGMGVAHKDIFMKILESELNNSKDTNYQVINMGSIGYTTDNEYLLLKEKGLQLDPDLVIVAFFAGNDVTEFRRHEWETDQDGKLIALTDTEHYVDQEKRLRYKGQEEPKSYALHFLDKRWQIFKKKFGLEKEEKKATLTWPAFLDPDDPNGDPRITEFWQQISTVLESMKNELDQRNIKLLVTAIPMDVQTSKKYWNKYAEMYFDDEAYEKNRPQTKLRELTEKLGIDLIDLLPYFREAGDDNWFYYQEQDPHWTVEGNKFAAKILFENLSL